MRPNESPLYRKIDALRPALAAAAQEIYEGWDQNEDGEDDELGGGGICDRVAEAMAGILADAGIDTTDGGQDGGDHAWTVAYDAQTAYDVDIPPGVYETGGGFSWRKLWDVTIQASDVEIREFPRSDLDAEPRDNPPAPVTP